MYYFNRIATRCIRNLSNEYIIHHESIFNQTAKLLSEQTPKHSQFHIPEPDFLTNGFLHSSAGIVAFKKQPNSHVLDEYLHCQIEGLSYFDKVFRGLAEFQTPHGDIMVKHHQILSTGIDGRRSYPVGFSSESSKQVAGKIRHTGGRVAFPVRHSKAVKTVLYALTEIDFYPDGWWNIEIDGIPEKAWSKAKRVQRGFDIVHPDGKHIPLYFSKMGECLKYLRYLQSNSLSVKDNSVMLRALATYFHLGIHSHAFVRINQSLLWTQVNYILMLNNYKPVHHGFVDLVAALLHTGPFCSYFERYVREHSSTTDRSACSGEGG